jgi:hypothetical protein
MFWFNKNHPKVTYMDKRRETHKLSNGATLNVNPDVLGDFTSMPFPDETFYLVVFDPPHMRAGDHGWMAKKYGSLTGDTWKQIICAGFTECMRVLRAECGQGRRVR